MASGSSGPVVIKDPNGLRVKLSTDRYLRDNRRTASRAKPNQKISNLIWKSLQKQNHLIINRVSWVVGNGTKMNIVKGQYFQLRKILPMKQDKREYWLPWTVQNLTQRYDSNLRLDKNGPDLLRLYIHLSSTRIQSILKQVRDLNLHPMMVNLTTLTCFVRV